MVERGYLDQGRFAYGVWPVYTMGMTAITQVVFVGTGVSRCGVELNGSRELEANF